MIKYIIISIIFFVGVILSGSYGYHLADERIGLYIQQTAVENAIFYHKHLSEIITTIEAGDPESAIYQLKQLKGVEEVLFDSCLKSDCPDKLRGEIESTLKP